MRTASALALTALVLSAATLAACGQDGPRGDSLKGGAPASGGAMPPGHPTTPPQGLPEGHPPVGAGSAGPIPERRPVPFTWAAPGGWTETKPSSAMRFAQYEIAGKWPDGAAVQVAFFANLGGGRDANIDRWVGQFAQKDGSDSKSKLSTKESQSGALKVTRVELTGSFSDGMQRPPRQTDDGMLLGAIVEAADGANLFVKLAGPRAAVEAEKARFDELIASFKAE